jgi:transposase-like protein
MFDQDVDPVQVARQLRVSTKSAYQWRRRWRAGGLAALASKGAGGAACRLDDRQLARLRAAVSDALSLELGEQEIEDPVRRRTFVELTSTSLLASILDVAPDKRPLDAEPLVPVLTRHVADTGLEQPGAPSDIAALTAAVNHARRQYQACRYSELISQLPQLLVSLHAACLSLDGEAKSRAFVLSADTYHVAAGLLLKLDDQGLAYLAADRSMRAAQASEDPVTVGASARIITPALMDGGHLAAAVSTASSHAARLDRDLSSHTPESLSVYGSLLLRGAIAAAQHDQRAAAHELLDEADGAARRLGADGNLRWTAFGPTNAKLHRVNIAVTSAMPRPLSM